MYKKCDSIRSIFWAVIFIYVLHIIPTLAENFRNATTLLLKVGYIIAMIACLITITSCIVFFRRKWFNNCHTPPNNPDWTRQQSASVKPGWNCTVGASGKNEMRHHLPFWYSHKKALFSSLIDAIRIHCIPPPSPRICPSENTTAAKYRVNSYLRIARAGRTSDENSLTIKTGCEPEVGVRPVTSCSVYPRRAEAKLFPVPQPSPRYADDWKSPGFNQVIPPCAIIIFHSRCRLVSFNEWILVWYVGCYWRIWPCPQDRAFLYLSLCRCPAPLALTLSGSCCFRDSFHLSHLRLYPVDIIAQCVCWYLGLRNLEEQVTSRGLIVDHRTLQWHRRLIRLVPFWDKYSRRHRINWPLFHPWHHGNRKSPHSFFYHSVALECRYQYVLLIRDIGTFGCDVVHNSFYSPNKPAGASFPAGCPSADQCELLVVQPLNDKLFAKKNYYEFRCSCQRR